jgi:hypothetical protein
VRNLLLLDIPKFCELTDVTVVGPVAESGEVAVGAAFPGVFGGGLAVHLQNAAARPPEHSADDVNVVDLHGCSGGLVGLVEPLKYRRHQRLGGADQFRGLAHVSGGHVADLFRTLRRELGHPLTQLVEADGMGGDVVAVDPVVADDFVQ